MLLKDYLTDTLLARPPGPNELEISLFGPGYGEGIVVHLGAGDWIAVDSCVGADHKSVTAKYLKEIGVPVKTAVRKIVATHWHDDHIRGLSELVREFESAELIVSGSIGERQFLRLVETVKKNSKMNTTGADEWNGIIETLTERRTHKPSNFRPPRCVIGESPIFVRPANPSNGTVACEVTCLSPSSESFLLARSEFEEMFPKAGSAKKRLVPRNPNHTSVVLWIRCGNVRLLLGADLQNTGSPNSGWTAIVQSTLRPSGLADVFKVPHHGSVNGHNDDVWKKMIVSGSAAMVAPLIKGDNSLPTPADLSRIKANAGTCLITALPVRKRVKFGNKVVAKTVSQVTKAIRNVPLSSGHIRLRNLPGQPWSVGLFGTAQIVP